MKVKHIEIGVNILFWILSGWLIIQGFSIVGKEIEVIDGIETIRIERDSHAIRGLMMILIFSIILFYGNYFGLQRLTKSIPRWEIIAASIFSFAIAFGACLAINSIPPVPPWTMTLGLLLFYFTISTAYAMVKAFVQIEKRNEALQTQKNEAELSLMRAQLHPHFLFNTLNNLLSTVDQKKNPKLAHSIDQLSSLLRYVVTDIQADKVPVRKEIEFIRNYADLHQLRFEENEVDFDLQIYGSFDEQVVEPGLFVPFIENAFKYGVEPEKKSKIMVMFDLREKGKIHFSCKNEIFPEMQKLTGSGTGIESSKNRLEMIYPGKHKIFIYERELFEVIIELTTI